MGFKSIFFKDEEVKQEQGVKVNLEEIETSSEETDLFSSAIVQQAEEGGVVGVYDQDIYNQLSTAITEQDLPGDDYLEFKASLKKLATYIPDEGKLYKAAFDTLNLSVESLLKSLSHYLDVVEGEKAKFKNDLTGAVAEQVGKKETELVNLNDKREDYKAQIAELEAKISELNVYEGTVKTDLQQSKTKLMVTDANFTVTANVLIDKLTADAEKIKNHLDGAEKSTK